MRTVIKIIMTLAVVSILIMSCKKFVDIKSDSTILLVESAEDAQKLLNNYSKLNTDYPADAEISADNYNVTDSYYSSLDKQSDRDTYIWSSGAMQSSEAYTKAYLRIYYANVAIETATKLKGKTDQAILDGIRGQALFFRAYNLYSLAQIYTKPYVIATAEMDPGLPIRLTSDINEISGRGNLAQTYESITTDLQESSNLLQSKETISSRPSKVAAYAMLARVYLSMGEYSKAFENANATLAINNQLIDYNTIIPPFDNPFERFNKEVLFHSVISNNAPLEPGGEGARIDPALYNSYSANDLRKALYFTANTDGSGTVYFSGNYEPAVSSTLFNGLAVDEILLIRAECQARLGNTVAAMADLNTLLAKRWLTGTYVNMVAATADDALNLILMERRKELVMRSQRWTDLRRLNQESRFAVTLTRTIGGTTYSLPPKDLRYTLLIPNKVILNSGGVIFQNAR